MPPVLADTEDALARARALLPRFRARVESTEQRRTVPEESIAELLAAGLFGILVPRRWGRSELAVVDLVRSRTCQVLRRR
jgi:3-hydroxy-9,10-secoandrosta-1,3,5(10)-triene-9,17-dione monooxygenase